LEDVYAMGNPELTLPFSGMDPTLLNRVSGKVNAMACDALLTTKEVVTSGAGR
jgi:hypothetical protein